MSSMQRTPVAPLCPAPRASLCDRILCCLSDPDTTPCQWHRSAHKQQGQTGANNNGCDRAPHKCPNRRTDPWRCYYVERLVRQWTSMQRTRRSTPKGGPLTQLALGLHTVAGQNSAAVICVRAYRGGHRHRSYSTARHRSYPTARCRNGAESLTPFLAVAFKYSCTRSSTEVRVYRIH